MGAPKAISIPSPMNCSTSPRCSRMARSRITSRGLVDATQGGEVAEVREENCDLRRLPLEGHPPGQDLVADLAAPVLPEGLLQELVLLKAGRPVLAAVAYCLTVFVTVSATLAECRRSRVATVSP